MSFISQVPVDQVVEMEPEDLAPSMLRYLKAQQRISRYTIISHADAQGLPANHRNKYLQVLSEAWTWLEREGFIAPRLDENQGSFVTRKGMRIVDDQNFEAYRIVSLFPSHIDPVLAQHVKPLFTRGDYDTAVFRAFKEVEVRVRRKAGLPDTAYGVQLMNDAFGENGDLTDKLAPKSEQQRIRDLFAGAIGAFKNPSSHRDVKFDDPREVVDLIATANQLLRIVERV